MTTPLKQEQRIAALERQVAQLQAQILNQPRVPNLTTKVKVRNAKTTTSTSYPTGYANTFEMVTVDSSYTRTAGSQGVTDTDRDAGVQFTGRTAEGTNMLENTVMPIFEVDGADGKTYVFILDYATLWHAVAKEDFGATTAGECSADLKDIFENDTLTDVTVYDPLGTFSLVKTNEEMLVVRQGGRYIVIQAECP